MKILQTSDWHLGKNLYHLDRHDDFVFFLDWLLQSIKHEAPDLILVPGDIFDSPNPGHKALGLYLKFIDDVLNSTNAHLFFIAGNHDSANLIELPQIIRHSPRLHLQGHITLNKDKGLRTIKIGEMTIEVLLFPYFRQFELTRLQGQLEIEKNQSISLFFEQYLKRILSKPNNKADLRIFMGHHLYGAYEFSGSEYQLPLSGADSISLDPLGDHFDIICVGHIHKPMTLKKNSPLAYYSGAPMSFRFGEGNKKSILLYEYQKGVLTNRAIDIPMIRPLIKHNIESNIIDQSFDLLKDKLSQLGKTPFRPYVEITYIKKEGRLTPLAEIQERAGQLNIELAPIQISHHENIKSFYDKEVRDMVSLNHLPTEKLFSSYYLSLYPDEQEIPSSLQTTFKKLLLKTRSQINEQEDQLEN